MSFTGCNYDVATYTANVQQSEGPGLYIHNTPRPPYQTSDKDRTDRVDNLSTLIGICAEDAACAKTSILPIHKNIVALDPWRQSDPTRITYASNRGSGSDWWGYPIENDVQDRLSGVSSRTHARDNHTPRCVAPMDQSASVPSPSNQLPASLRNFEKSPFGDDRIPLLVKKQAPRERTYIA